MANKTYKLGELIERRTANNKDLKYGTDLIAGVSNEGIFTLPKGDTTGVDLKPYKIVENGAFVYNPTRLNLGSIAYRSDGMCIVSHLYIVFYLNQKGKELVNPKWLFMYFRRNEFYREVTFRNFGSQRPEFSYHDMCDIEITLPSLEIQQKFVSIYEALLENVQSFRQGLDDLKLVCDGYLDKLKKESKKIKIGELFTEIDRRNAGSKFTKVKGINIDKEFMNSVADINGVDLSKYKVIEKNELAFSGMQTGRDGCIRIALSNSDEPFLISPAYSTFQVDEKKVLPKYIMLWFSRKEIDRLGSFYSDGSIRANLDNDRLFDMQIPIPSIEIQKSIAEIYNAYTERKQIAERLNEQIKQICPVLIKGSLGEQDG